MHIAYAYADAYACEEGMCWAIVGGPPTWWPRYMRVLGKARWAIRYDKQIAFYKNLKREVEPTLHARCRGTGTKNTTQFYFSIFKWLNCKISNHSTETEDDASGSIPYLLFDLTNRHHSSERYGRLTTSCYAGLPGKIQRIWLHCGCRSANFKR